MARFFSLRTYYVLLLLSAATGLEIAVGSVAEAKEPEQAFGWTAAPVRLYEAEGSERRLLDRFQRYLDQKQWDDAFESAARLLQEDRSSVVSVSDRRFVSTGEYVHQQLAKLPHEVLAEYRGLVDSLAEAWYQQGIGERDQRLLRQVVDEFFCSRWGDEALFALGELSLEQGEHQAARGHWRRISSELQFPNEQIPTEQVVLAYPDTDIDLAEVRARLALVSLYEGDLERAKKEIQSLFQNSKNPSPNPSPEDRGGGLGIGTKTLSAIDGLAAGRLGGQEVVYAEALEQMLQHAKGWQRRSAKSDWPTFAGSLARTNASLFAGQTTYEKLWTRSLGEAAENRRSTFPVVLGKFLLYQNATQVEAVRLDTGERVFVAEGAAFQSPAIEADCQGRPCYTLTGNGVGIFGTTKAPIARRRVAGRARSLASLWGIDLRRDGALSFQQRAESGNLVFAGAPVEVGDRLWVALQASGTTARAGIACYDLATKKQLWQRWVCQANTPASGRADELVTNLLTYDSGVVYSCTNLGAIAATRADDGRPLWITTYERTASAGDDSYYRDPNPCVFSRGMLFVLPTDSQELLALDASTGIVIWRHKLTSSTGQILGVANENLLVSDEGFRTFDLRTGEPKVYAEELRLFGHPVIVGETLYWPTYQGIEAIEVATGELAEENLQLPESGGANLLVAGEYLVAAGPSQVTVYRAQTAPAESPQIPQFP